MLNVVKSALNRMRPAGNPDPESPKAPHDTFARRRRARAAYDSRQGAGAVPKARVPRPPSAEFSITPRKLTDARTLLAAMRVDMFIAQYLLYASCPPTLAQHPTVQAYQLEAIEERFYTLNPAPLLTEAARDLAAALPGRALASLSEFARTPAGAALFVQLPTLQLQLKYGNFLGPESLAAADHDKARAVAGCLRQVNSDMAAALQRVPSDLLDELLSPFAEPVVDEMALYLGTPSGRAFAAYAQRACWLGVPNALILQRHSWLHTMQSTMVTLLEEDGVSLPPPWGDMPVYVPSSVKIEELPA